MKRDMHIHDLSNHLGTILLAVSNIRMKTNDEFIDKNLLVIEKKVRQSNSIVKRLSGGGR